MNDTLRRDLFRAYRSGAPPTELVYALRGAAPAKDPIPFRMISAPVSATTRRLPDDGGEQRLIRGTHSSNETDLYGTRMTRRALESMRRSALDNLTIFLNHDYTVPESVLGSVVGAELVNRAPFIDLDMEVEPLPPGYNERVDKAYRYIKHGTKLGFSIGCYILDYEWMDGDGKPMPDFDPWDDEWEEGYALGILDVLLFESSLVGVPANRRSWARNSASYAARRSLLAAGLVPDKPRLRATRAGIVIPDWYPRPQETEEVRMPPDAATTPDARRDPADAGRDHDPLSDPVSDDAPGALDGEGFADGLTADADFDEDGAAGGDPTPADLEAQIDALEAGLFGPSPVTPPAQPQTRHMSSDDRDYLREAHDHAAHVLGMACCMMVGCTGHAPGHDMSKRTAPLHDSAYHMTAVHDHCAHLLGMTCAGGGGAHGYSAPGASSLTMTVPGGDTLLTTPAGAVQRMQHGTGTVTAPVNQSGFVQILDGSLASLPNILVAGETADDPLKEARAVLAALQAMIAAASALRGEIIASYQAMQAESEQLLAQRFAFEDALSEANKIGLYRPTNRQAVRAVAPSARPLSDEELEKMSDAEVVAHLRAQRNAQGL